MKKHIMFVIVFSLVGVFFAADTLQDNFDKANQWYQEGRYEEALGLYRELKEQITHWKLFYNIANCYFKTGRYVQAKIFYLRAARLKPFESSIRHNVAVVDQKFNEMIPTPDVDFVKKIVLKFESVLTVDVLSVLLLLCLMSFNASLFLLLYRGRRKWLVYGLAFSLLLSLLFGLYHVQRVHKLSVRDQAVVVSEVSNLLSGPGDGNTVLFKVNPGILVRIVSRSGDWVQVTASSQVAGWIRANMLEQI